MNLYEVWDYKAYVRYRLKELGKERKSLTLKRVAEKIPIQYTYLSKALRDDKTHLNEDDFYSLCQMLLLLPDEVDYLFLLRSMAVAQNTTRKAFLENKINRIRRAKELNAEVQEFQSAQLGQEMGYLFDPLCILVHVSLFIKEYRDNPRRLSPLLGISHERLNQVIKRLNEINYLELGPGGTVAKILKEQIHYGTDHPLMRMHQVLLRQFSAAHLQKISEQEKRSFMTTFSSDAETFRAIEERFQLFLKEVEKLAIRSRSEHTYQINFDLFQWL